MTERRRFSRVVYRVPASIMQNGHMMIAHIHDLSLHGLLLHTDQTPSLDIDQPVDVVFSLSGSDIDISLNAMLVNIDHHAIRLKIRHIDIEGICHLRRLVELNVGDDAFLNRELEYLSDLGHE